MFQIITDGASDIKREEAQKHGIDIVPFYITLDGQNFAKETEGFSREEFFKTLANDKNIKPKTSQPNPQDYIDFYIPHLKAGKDILTVTIASGLSGSYNSATQAAKLMAEEYPDRKILVLDTFNITAGQALIIDQIIKMREAGFSIQETFEKAEKIKETTHIYFILETMEFLKRSGRIGGAAALVGGMLKIKPILQMLNNRVEKFDSVRGTKNALKRMFDYVISEISDKKDDVEFTVGHISNLEAAIEYKNNFEKALGKKAGRDVIDIGMMIGVHVGPGALLVAYCKNYDKV